MKKIILILSLAVCLSMTIIFTVFHKFEKYYDKKNGFIRNFNKEKVKIERLIHIENKSYSFLNVSQDSITLYEYKKPSQIVTFSFDLAKRKDYTLPNLGNIVHADGMNSATQIGNEKVLILGKASKAYRINTRNKNLDSSILSKDFLYQSQALSPHSFIAIMENRKKGRRNEITKINWNGEKVRVYVPHQQFDGIISTDGQFKYLRDSHSIIFVFYYRGEIVCLDTNLTVKYKAKTIDTVKHANILLKNISGNKKMVAIAPPIINRRIGVGDNRIFIQSNLKSDIEDKSVFEKSDVIDVYSIIDGKYLSSFYLPTIENGRAKNFIVYKNRLIATYKHTLAIFTIPKT